MNEFDGRQNMSSGNLNQDSVYNNLKATNNNNNDFNNEQYQSNNNNNQINENNNSFQQNKEFNNQNLNTENNQNMAIRLQQNKNRKDNQRFNIIIRIRPKVPNDTLELTTDEELKPCIFQTQSNKILLRNEKTDNDYEMTFDQVFNEKSTQESLYYSFGEKLVKDVFKGYNGTIMAYGQTGSGKSYTIFGKSVIESDKQLYNINQGIVQRAIHQIFEYKAQNKGKKHISVFISFMQVYLNQITDLLDEKNGDVIFNADKPQFKLGKESKNLSIENSLSIARNKEGKVYVKNLIKKEVENEKSLLSAIDNGINYRMTAQTIMNKTSSRSHAILQITVKQKWIERVKNNSTNEITDNLHNLKGIFTVVDLAGSESVSRTGSEGINQDEAKEINKSISALGRVIEALSRQSRYLNYNVNNNNKTNNGNFYVSYRDSKLTEILSECLGGNSKTYIIACVSPFTANCDETYSTLQFASRAMIIRTQPMKNEKIDTKKFNKDDTQSQIGFNLNQSNYSKKVDGNKKRLFGNNGVLINYKDNNNRRGKSHDLNRNSNKNIISNFGSINGIGNKEDFQAITKKFYSVILHLQDELGKLTVKNYSLEQENNFLKEQIKNFS